VFVAVKAYAPVARAAATTRMLRVRLRPLSARFIVVYSRSEEGVTHSG
jgi:hypothetical protein